MLSTEPVLCKAAVDRGLRLSTEQYGCRQGSDFVKCAVRVFFIVCFYIFWVQPVPAIPVVCYCLNVLEVWLITCFNAERN